MRIWKTMSIALAISVAIVGWFGLGRLELGASDSLVATSEALVSVEASLRGSTDVANGTADALDAAAESLDAAAETSDSTGEVAANIAEMARTLPPVVIGVADGLDQLDRTLNEVQLAFDRLPFDLGFSTDTLRLDPALSDVDPFLDDLDEAQRSLDGLSADAELLGPRSRDLATELRIVATNLRQSTEDISSLADDVGDAQSSIDGVVGGEAVDLWLAQVLLVALCGAIVAANLGSFATVRSARLDEPIVRSTNVPSDHVPSQPPRSETQR